MAKNDKAKKDVQPRSIVIPDELKAIFANAAREPQQIENSYDSRALAMESIAEAAQTIAVVTSQVLIEMSAHLSTAGFHPSTESRI